MSISSVGNFMFTISFNRSVLWSHSMLSEPKGFFHGDFCYLLVLGFVYPGFLSVHLFRKAFKYLTIMES